MCVTSFEHVPRLSGTRSLRDAETVSLLNIQWVHAQPKLVSSVQRGCCGQAGHTGAHGFAMTCGYHML